MTGKSIAIGVVIFGAGFITGWAARALVKQKNEELNDEKESEKQGNNIYIKNITKEDKDRIINDYISKKYRQETFSDVEKEAIEEAAAENESPSEEDDEDDEIEPRFDYGKDPYDDYVDYRPVNPYGEDPEDYEEEGNEKLHKKNIWPYEITVEEFEEHNGYTKSTLEYYKNNVLIDEDGSEITNAGSIIGSGVLKNLMVSKDVAYVRNEALQIDYEIAFVNETYESYDDDDDWK